MVKIQLSLQISYLLIFRRQFFGHTLQSFVHKPILMGQIRYLPSTLLLFLCSSYNAACDLGFKNDYQICRANYRDWNYYCNGPTPCRLAILIQRSHISPRRQGGHICRYHEPEPRLLSQKPNPMSPSWPLSQRAVFSRGSLFRAGVPPPLAPYAWLRWCRRRRRRRPCPWRWKLGDHWLEKIMGVIGLEG